MSEKNEIFLFPGETLVDTFFEKGVRFEVVERAETLWCGVLGYAPDLTGEPDIEGLLAQYQTLAAIEKRGLASPGWSGCLSIDYWPGGNAPRGIMFMQQVSTAEQDARYHVYKTPASLYVRLHYNCTDVPQRLLGKAECGVFELFGPIHEAAVKNGYIFHSSEEIEIEYYGENEGFAYCAVKKAEQEDEPILRKF